MSKRKSKARPRFSPGGVPKRGAAYPGRHEQGVLRKIALSGYLMVTQREEGPLFTYATGEIVRNENRAELDTAGFKRLSAWLDPDRGDSLFPDGPAQIWHAWKPPL